MTKNLHPAALLYTLLLIIVYAMGCSIPLFDHDSSHHALIGMRMYLTGNYVELMDRGKDYLDKPHLLFWLSALGNQLWGTGTLAYKLPSVILSLPGIYATYRLGKHFYGKQAGIYAVVILLSTQAFILSLNDVRMDALLMSFMVSATWFLYYYTITGRFSHLLSGSVFLALAFATKGMSGVAVPVIAVGLQLLYSRNWKFLLSFKWLWAVLLFFLFISPVLYCYYLQFDLHPEKVIRGSSNISGVAFILFSQNTERFTGVNWGGSGANDPFFFFHTLLWALLPWCLLAYWAYFKKSRTLFTQKFREQPGGEIISWGTITVMFTILSMSGFKLPHYLNILFPFFALLIAGTLQEITEGRKLLNVQKFVAVVMVLMILIISGYLFPIQSWLPAVPALLAAGLIVYEWITPAHWRRKLVYLSLGVSIFANLLMNGSFYPQVQQYQAGHRIAAKAKELGIAPETLFYYDSSWESPSLNYYLGAFPETLESLPESAHQFWVVGPSEKVLSAADSLEIVASYPFLDYHTSKLKRLFLDPATREDACTKVSLVQFRKR